MRRMLSVLAIVVLAGVTPGLPGLGADAAAQSYKAEFKNSLVTNDQTSWGQSAIKFAELLKERTQGRINVKNYWSG